jgi:hypothetical protein
MVFPPQLVLPPPPSAWATVGTTKVLRNIRAAAMMSRLRFMGGFLLVFENQVVILSWLSGGLKDYGGHFAVRNS